MNHFVAALGLLFVTTVASACTSGPAAFGPEGPQACPAAPDRMSIELIDGAACTTADEDCASTDGCGCSLTCRNGFWGLTHPQELCAKNDGPC